MIATSLQTTYASLLDVLLSSHQGHVNIQLISSTQLKDELVRIKANLPSGLRFPAYKDDLTSVYKLMTIQGTTNNKHVIFRLQLPLLEPESYNIFETIPVPVTINDTIVAVKPASSYIIINDHRDRYYPLSDQELTQCTQPVPDTYLCHGRHPIYKIGSRTGSCEIAMLNLTAEIINARCSPIYIGIHPRSSSDPRGSVLRMEEETHKQQTITTPTSAAPTRLISLHSELGPVNRRLGSSAGRMFMLKVRCIGLNPASNELAIQDAVHSAQLDVVFPHRMYEGILESLNLKDDWMINDSVANGSCFFDSFRQSLNNLNGTVVTIHDLRRKCKEYAEENSSVRWLIEAIAYNSNNITGEATYESIDEYCQNILQDDRWGNPDTEGRILCEMYNVKLMVIEIFGDPQFLFNLVTEEGVKHVQPNFNDRSTIFIINDGANHFLPLLRKDSIYDTALKRKERSENCSVYNKKPKIHDFGLKNLVVSLERCDNLVSKSNETESNGAFGNKSQNGTNPIPDMNYFQTSVDVTNKNISCKETDGRLKTDDFINGYSHFNEINQKQKDADSLHVESDTKNCSTDIDSRPPQQSQKFIVFENIHIPNEVEVFAKYAARWSQSKDIIFCRKSELKLFHRILKIYKTVWVTEKFIHSEFSSAIGKTIFIKHYIQKYFSPITNSVAWIDCENFKKFYRKLQEVNKNFKEATLLTVFDNVNSEKVVSYLHNSLSNYRGLYKIIITNILSRTSINSTTFRIKELRIRDACKFVKKILNISKRVKTYDKNIQNFVTKLHRHPLALKLSLSFIEQKLSQIKFTFDDFIRLYDEKDALNESEMEKLYSANAFPIFLVVHRIMTLVLKQIKSDEDNGDIALKALYYLSLFPKTNIKLDDLAAKLSANTLRLQIAIKLLTDFSIIRMKSDCYNVVYIPKILQYIAKHILSKLLNKCSD